MSIFGGECMIYGCSEKEDKCPIVNLKEFYCDDCPDIKYRRGVKEYFCSKDKYKRIVTRDKPAEAWCPYRHDYNK